MLKVDLKSLNRYCLVCGKEFGPHLVVHCTTGSLLAISYDRVLRKRRRYFDLDTAVELSADDVARKEEELRANYHIEKQQPRTVSLPRFEAIGVTASDDTRGLSATEPRRSLETNLRVPALEQPAAAPAEDGPTAQEIHHSDRRDSLNEALIERARPLRDPLLIVRDCFVGLTMYNALILLVLVIAVSSHINPIEHFREFAHALLRCLSPLVYAGLSLLIVLILPRSMPSGLLLRRFKADRPDDHELRSALREGLGRKGRLSGVRDPGRRFPPPLLLLAPLIFTFAYRSRIDLDLEAGDDWPVRLWRSLCFTKLAIVDATEFNEWVRLEARLAVMCLGLERVLFVGDSTRTIEAWQLEVFRHLGDSLSRPSEHYANVLRRPPQGTTDQRAHDVFVSGVRAFCERCVTQPRALRTNEQLAAFSMVEQFVLPADAQHAERRRYFLMAVVPFVVLGNLWLFLG